MYCFDSLCMDVYEWLSFIANCNYDVIRVYMCTYSRKPTHPFYANIPVLYLHFVKLYYDNVKRSRKEYRV